jgi:3-phosphoshikimate 1-carboxyvinyltransferase
MNLRSEVDSVDRTVRRPAQLRGTIQVPGDKSVSHRAALFGALATGTSHARGFLAAEDCLSTLSCLHALGVESRLDENDGTLEIQGVGLHGLREPSDVLDCGNSGTTLRLIAGILAGQPFVSVLTGDASLRTRPVDRIIQPLREMGAQLIARDNDRSPPLTIRGGNLDGIHYRPAVASAQVKSAVLLAGLFAKGETIVEEPGVTRDHTERMLRAMGVDVRREGPGVRLTPPDALAPVDLRVPGDISSAAFWIAAGVTHPNAELLLTNVGINPTRTGLLDALRSMGASIDILEERVVGEEPVADLCVRSSELHGVEVGGETALRMMDEFPALALAAARARGTTIVRDAAELRVKESDRIAALCMQLRALGVAIEERPDGFVIEGGKTLRGAPVTGAGDHRMTMTLAVAGLLAEGETTVQDGDAVGVSYPAFWRDLESIADPMTGSHPKETAHGH